MSKFENSPAFQRHYGHLSEKVIKLRQAIDKAGRSEKQAKAPEKLIYEWTKKGDINFADFCLLVDTLAYLWEFGVLPLPPGYSPE